MVTESYMKARRFRQELIKTVGNFFLQYMEDEGSLPEYKLVVNLVKGLNLTCEDSSCIDPTEMTLSELRELGSEPYDEEGLELLPAWLFYIIEPGTQLTTITGEVVSFSPYTHATETLAGLLPFGVYPKESEEDNNE